MNEYEKTLIYILAGALMLCACDKSAPVSGDTSSKEISFNMSLSGTVTKVNQYGFQIGDQIGLWAVERTGGQKMPLQVGGNFINNEPLTQTSSNHWQGSRPLYWSSVNCDFYGVFPYQAGITSVEEQPLSIALDQSVYNNFVGSDILWACAENVAPGGVVNMQFRHMLSKLSVVIVEGENFEGTIPTDITVHIYNTSTSGKVNLCKGSVEKDSFAPKGTITAYKVSDHRFETIVVPQFVEKKTPLIEVTMGGIAYLLEYSISLRPGYEHTIQLTLNTSPDQEMIEIGIDAETGGWN